MSGLEEASQIISCREDIRLEHYVQDDHKLKVQDVTN